MPEKQSDAPQPRAIEKLIRSKYDEMPGSERALADHVLEYPNEVLLYSATELADRAGASKAAVNMIRVNLSRDLAPRGIAVGILHPGYVRTQMTEGRGEIEPEQAAKGLLARIEELDLASTGPILLPTHAVHPNLTFRPNAVE